MKKLSIITMVCAVALISSCTSTPKAPKASLSNDVDSLSYAIGVSQMGRVTNYLAQMKIDSTYMDDFLKGFLEGVFVQDDDIKKTAYIAGLQIGQQFGGQLLEQFSQQIFGEESEERLSKDNFVAGFTASASKNDDIMSNEEAGNYIEAKIEELEMKRLDKEFGFNRDAGYAFLEENKTKDGVVVLPSGLQYKVITAGKGKTPALTDRVKVHYRGTLIDGTEFDSSHKGDGKPASFAVMNVISGWTEALSIMPVGSKWMLYIPQELAYGEQQKGQFIMPFSALVFEVELIEIEKQPDRQ